MNSFLANRSHSNSNASAEIGNFEDGRGEIESDVTPTGLTPAPVPVFNAFETSEVPEWLKNDLASADFIPMKQPSQPPQQNMQKNNDLSSIKVFCSFI